MNRIKRVAIVGGTHGNELTGVYLVKKFQQVPKLIHRQSFESLTILANPKASEICRRYVDTDLNRCFRRQDLENPKVSRRERERGLGRGLSTYEQLRAKEIYETIAGKTDFIMDLHSTTANMGLTIIPSSDRPFNLQLAAYLQSVNPKVKVYRWATTLEESPFLRSLCELGCAIEVGSVAQGILDANLFRQTSELIYAVLDYLEAYNQGKKLPVASTLTLYQCVETIDYPRNSQGDLQAMVHPQLQFQDYQPLNPGDAMFLTIDGEVIPYVGTETVYPVFINEAAYYEKGIAMCLTLKQQVMI